MNEEVVRIDLLELGKALGAAKLLTDKIAHLVLEKLAVNTTVLPVNEVVHLLTQAELGGSNNATILLQVLALARTRNTKEGSSKEEIASKNQELFIQLFNLVGKSQSILCRITGISTPQMCGILKTSKRHLSGLSEKNVVQILLHREQIIALTPDENRTQVGLLFDELGKSLNLS